MSEHILQPPAVKRLERSRSSRVVAGVCAGLGRYFDLTPAVFRLGFVVLTILGGAGILVYIAAVLVMPKEGDESSIAEEILRNRRDHPVQLVALGLVAIAILSLLARASTWPTAGAAWALITIAGVVLLWTGTRGRRRGLFVALVSLVALIVVIGVAAVTAAFAWFDVSLGDGVGNHAYAPASASALPHRYTLGIGRLRLDLTRLPATAPAHVSAKVGIGNLRIVLAPDARARVVVHVKAGAVDVLGHHEDGTNVRFTTGSGNVLTIDANVGAGHIEVVRAR
ncbi:MAG TPA: PspC domain-containing protein [Gaiellaceae bacterium]|nr:PspC domain-containing protein [Gaiellaceae bacterium]